MQEWTPSRRRFLAGSIATVWSAGLPPGGLPQSGPNRAEQVRRWFPGYGEQIFLNAAGGTPLSSHAAAGIERYLDYWRDGPGVEGWDRIEEMLTGCRRRFARLIGAQPSEIAFLQCTKAGEQVLLDGLPALRAGGNVVTNDLHFSGSLHNLEGLRRVGLDVRVARGGWEPGLDAMKRLIDDRTALVTVALVSNVNGHIEPIAELSELAHAHGAVLFADIIQAAGIVPIDVQAMGIDFAACSGYKWLYGPHGAAFFYARQELQGSDQLPDRLFPGHVQRNYPPFAGSPDPQAPPFSFDPPRDAGRYRPGHPSYLGYCALYEALGWLLEMGVQAVQGHSVRLCRRLLERLDLDRYPCLSPHLDRSPILTVKKESSEPLQPALRKAGITVSESGGRLRVSPALYNTEEDVDRLAEVLHALPAP